MNSSIFYCKKPLFITIHTGSRCRADINVHPLAFNHQTSFSSSSIILWGIRPSSLSTVAFSLPFFSSIPNLWVLFCHNYSTFCWVFHFLFFCFFFFILFFIFSLFWVNWFVSMFSTFSAPVLKRFSLDSYCLFCLSFLLIFIGIFLYLLFIFSWITSMVNTSGPLDSLYSLNHPKSCCIIQANYLECGS